jgi:inorganic pyrophosphatase
MTQAGAVHAYIEIPRGDRQKFEFDIRANRLALDRVIPEEVGGYPVNYGFVPQTVSYDGDPFDALVLGPPLARGTLTSGVILGLMSMEDEKGLDSKVVLSAVGDDGRPRYALTAAERDRIADYFSRYKRHEPGKFSKVHGWGTAAEGRAFVEMTNAFFRRCTKQANADCRLDR